MAENSTVQAVAKDFTAMCTRGDFDKAGQTYWSPNIVSVEAYPGPQARVEGLAAVKKKGEEWSAIHDIHSFSTHGPYVNGDQFAVRFEMDVTNKQSGERMNMDEVAVYTVKDGKIVEERFYY